MVALAPNEGGAGTWRDVATIWRLRMGVSPPARHNWNAAKLWMQLSSLRMYIHRRGFLFACTQTLGGHLRLYTILTCNLSKLVY